MMMGVVMTDNLKTVDFMEKVFFNGRMVVFSKVHMPMACGMDTDSSIILNLKLYIRVFGRKEY